MFQVILMPCLGQLRLVVFTFDWLLKEGVLSCCCLVLFFAIFCPFNNIQQEERAEEFEHPDLFWSLSSCMKPLMSIAQTEKTLVTWTWRGRGTVQGLVFQGKSVGNHCHHCHHCHHMGVSWVIGLPPVMIHFERWCFPCHKNHPAGLGYPHFYGNPHMVNNDILWL